LSSAVVLGRGVLAFGGFDAWCCFFFQAEDGIRDFHVTGVQTCALPIWEHERRYTTQWAAKVVPANWKAVAEAFMEAFHVIATHPQIMPFTGDANSKYNLYGDHVNLAITPFGDTSPHLKDRQLSEQEVMNAFLRYNGRVVPQGETITVPEGKTARQTMGAFNRERFAKQAGIDLD